MQAEKPYMLRLRHSLLAHQREGVAKCFEREDAYGIVLLWLDPGLGKTLHALAVATAKRAETLDVKMPVPRSIRSFLNSATDPDSVVADLENDDNDTDSPKGQSRQDKTEVEEILESVRRRCTALSNAGTSNAESTPNEEAADYVLNSRATLVVCPKSSLNLWKKEIAKHVVGGPVIVVTLQTSVERVDLSILSHAHFVLITYDLLLSAFRGVPGSDVDLKRSPWAERYRSPFDDAVDYDIDAQHALEPVLSLQQAIDCCSITLLYALRFERVIFDEAHNVRTLASKKYRACVRLCARYRWAMTGSALQNEDIEETYCAFRLLHVPNLPLYGVWRSSLVPTKQFSRKRSRHTAFERREKQRFARIVTKNNHTFLRASQVNKDDESARSETNDNSVSPSAASSQSLSGLSGLFANVSSHFDAGKFAKNVIDRLAIVFKVDDIDAERDDVFASLMPRGFPDCVEQIVRGRFRNEEERQFYLSFRDQLNRTTSQMVEKKTKKKVVQLSDTESSAKSLQETDDKQSTLSAERVLSCSVMRLRQAAIAGALVMTRRLRLAEGEKSSNANDQGKNEEQRNEAKEEVVTQEEEATEEESEHRQVFKHPARYILSRKDTPWAFEGSTKMLMFRNYVQRTCLEQSNKVLVFSHFRGSLDLCANILDELHIEHVRVDGSVDSQTRHDYIARFQREETLLVFLIVVKAMGESVDGLQVNCNRVLFLDPWFNPEVEQQALRRVLRMGQRRRKVFVTRLVVQGTFEERVVNIAASKSNLLARVCAGNLGQSEGLATRQWTAGDVRDRLLYDEEGFVLQPTVRAEGEADNEHETIIQPTGRERYSQSRSTAVDHQMYTTASTSSMDCAVASVDSHNDADFLLQADTDEEGELKQKNNIGKRRRIDSSLSSKWSAALAARQRSDFETWCDASLFFAQTVPTAFFGATPVLFKRAHMRYETMRSAVFFSDDHGTIISSRAPRFYRQHRMAWTISDNDVWSSGLKLHVVGESILVSFIEQERLATDHHDPHRLGLLDNLIDALRQHRDAKTGAWARAEATFPPFEAFCALVPAYEEACNASLVHGWLWDSQTSHCDVPFVVLYKPQRFATIQL